jgi:hypothetical protein
MKWILVLWAMIAAALGLFILSHSQSAIHEIEAGIAAIVFTVALAGVAIVFAIEEKAKG